MASHSVLTSHRRGPRGRTMPAIGWSAAGLAVAAGKLQRDHRPDLAKAAGYFAPTAVSTSVQRALTEGRELHA